jgi:amino acid adenylation domain-containing protein
LARGYLHRPELTSERFVQSPFAPDARLYRTGDLARWRADGLLECLGRTDHQVKIRGFRIELGEIEAVLARHAAVRQAVVVAREDAPGDKRLVAYLVAENPPSDLVEQLRKLLRAAVPEYMVPSHFVELEGFPLTPNGKVDRKALPAPSESSVVATAETVGPRNQTEESLVAIWSELLSVDKIGIHDNFFELGGHSLLAIRAMTRIRDVFRVNLPLQRLFENPTVAGLAAAVLAVSSTAEEVRRIEPRKQTGPCPLSFAQEQFWLLHQMVPPGSPVYNIVDTIAISGTYHAFALKSALAELVRRHEILRTAFVLPDGQLRQMVSPASDLALPELDLTSLPELERAHRWTEFVREQGQKAFDLSQPPLFRATVIHHSEREHMVLLVIHHIVADEWAMRIIQDEVKQLYAAFSQHRPSPLAELPVQYADFACWQRDWFQGDKLEEQVAYWKKELEGASPVLALPTDKPRPSAQTFQGATEYFTLPKSLLRDLRALGLKEQATLFMLLEAAFAALLHRYSGQADILVGTPISGRTQSETGRLVGCFLNTVVLRSQLTAGQSFRAQLQQARARALGAFAHAELPFGRLVATVAADRDPSRTPLFQAMFVLHDPDGNSPVSNGFGHQELQTGTSKFDLSLYAAATEHGLDGLMEYNTDLFEADTISRLCRHFGVLLQAIARDPDQSVSGLPLLTEADRQQLLVEWNRTEADYPREVALAELVEAQVERTPEAVAVVCGSESLAFAELNARANQLAHELRAHGAGPDRLVGICVERSLDMVVSLLAVVKAGAAYLPLDPLFPPERLSYMLQDSGASLVVTQDSLRASLPAFSGTVVSLDETSWKSNPRDNLAVAVQPDHLAYVIYTSGSTGRPKGVEVLRGALTNLLWSMRQWLELTSEDRVLAITTISFDIAGLDIWLPLLVGARLVVASREEASDGARLRDKIDQQGITFLQATPVTWRLLLQAGWKGKSDLQIVCTGEAMPRDLAVELAPIAPRLWNLYGPTETTIWSTGYLVRDGNQPILIGRPVANTQCYILDGNGHPVPIGVVGELYLGGDGVARGYLRRPELTAEKFIPDPFRSQPGARMYRTGDLARYRADGNIECLGRTDHQVKIRGLRLELGEIEAVLAEHPAVRQAVLRVFEPKPGDQRLAAFYLSAPGAEVSAADLRKRLRSKLPDYMIPQQFIAVEQMPLTPSGKIDRKALVLPADAGGASGERVAPRTPTERFLADLWADLTGSKVESIGANDNFFDVGGHSLLALQAIARIQARTGVLLEARSMFLNSLNQIAEMLVAHSEGSKLPVPPRPNAAAPPGSA